jgi:hypothetical protein
MYFGARYFAARYFAARFFGARGPIVVRRPIKRLSATLATPQTSVRVRTARLAMTITEIDAATAARANEPTSNVSRSRAAVKVESP